MDQRGQRKRRGCSLRSSSSKVWSLCLRSTEQCSWEGGRPAGGHETHPDSTTNPSLANGPHDGGNTEVERRIRDSTFIKPTNPSENVCLDVFPSGFLPWMGLECSWISQWAVPLTTSHTMIFPDASPDASRRQ